MKVSAQVVCDLSSQVTWLVVTEVRSESFGSGWLQTAVTTVDRQIHNKSVSILRRWLTCNDHAAKEWSLQRRRPLTKHCVHRRKQHTLYTIATIWHDHCNIAAIAVEITATLSFPLRGGATILKVGGQILPAKWAENFLTPTFWPVGRQYVA